MRLISPLILIILAGGVFFWLTDPILNQPIAIDPETGIIDGGVLPLLAERRDLNTALASSAKLQEASQTLVEKYTALAESDKARIDKLLPDRIDNVQLVIDINSIANKYGMTIKNVKIRTAEEASASAGGRPVSRRSTATNAEQVAFLSFTVAGSYNQFLNFLTDLARSLRLVDVTELAFTATDQDFYQFNLELKTYWLE